MLYPSQTSVPLAGHISCMLHPPERGHSGRQRVCTSLLQQKGFFHFIELLSFLGPFWYICVFICFKLYVDGLCCLSTMMQHFVALLNSLVLHTIHKPPNFQISRVLLTKRVMNIIYLDQDVNQDGRFSPLYSQKETVIPTELPLVQEVTTTLREWAAIWRDLYVVSRPAPLLQSCRCLVVLSVHLFSYATFFYFCFLEFEAESTLVILCAAIIDTLNFLPCPKATRIHSPSPVDRGTSVRCLTLSAT